MANITVARTFPRSCPVPLTDDELRQYGEQNAREVQKLLDAEDEKKEVAAQLKAQADALKSEIRRLTRMINEKREWRNVDCREDVNWAEQSVDIVRLDTMEVVDSRPMTDAERQTRMRLE